MYYTRQALKLVSLISNPVIYLKDYLTLDDATKGKEIAIHYLPHFIDWLGGSGWTELPEEIQDTLPNELTDMWDIDDLDGIDRKLDAIPDNVYERFFIELPGDILNDPDSPTFLYMSFEDIVRNQWLIHFGDDAREIAYEGFTKGMDDYTRLGLTTSFTDEAKSFGGYNFAYDVDDFAKYGRDHLRGMWKYGKEAVMFRASGVRVWHHGDQEPQVIFYGASANSFVDLYETDEGWGVGESESGRPVYENADLENVVEWVEANYDQYRNVL